MSDGGFCHYCRKAQCECDKCQNCKRLESLNAQLQGESENMQRTLKAAEHLIGTLQINFGKEHELVAQLQRDLEGYAGWAPDQFLRYQEEHKKLQKLYVEQDTELVALRQQVTRLREELGKAPHDDRCESYPATGKACTCWKKDA